MSKFHLKYALYLTLPVFFLVSIGFVHADRKPVLEVRRVKISPAQPDYPGQSLSEYDTSIEIMLQDNTFSLLSRLKREGIKSRLNESYGLYIQDDKGVRYGTKCFPSDKRAYHPFIWKDGSKQGVALGGVRNYGNGLHSWKFLVPLAKIPSSAGKLTLKCLLQQENGKNTANLPINVVVRARQ